MRIVLSCLLICLPGSLLRADDCAQVAERLKLPAELKTSGKPRTAKWGDVEKMLTEVRDNLEGKSCQFTFRQIFVPKKADSFFPLISNVLRTAPEGSLRGVSVYSQDGYPLGTFENRVVFEKKGEYNYTHYYFQFSDSRGKIQSSGNRLLVDIQTGKPFFLVKWDEIAGRVAAAGRRDN